ncbi:MAG: tetratricopeptide repeat protein [Vicinamibacterales bacterium]
MSEKKVADAKARIDKRLQQHPSDANALVLGAMVFGTERNFAKSEELLRRAIDADATQMRAYGMLAQIYLAQNRLEEARIELEAIARRRPDNVGAATMAAMILGQQGRTADAEKAYAAIVARNPRAAVASNNLAWAYAERAEMLDQALQLAQAAKAELPDDPEINDTLAYVYLERKLPALAIPPLRVAIEKQPANPVFRFRLGQALAASGDPASAKRELESALKLKPDFPGAQQARELLATLR